MSKDRYVESEAFRDMTKSYCLRLAPVREWVKGESTYCCLESGHEGEHRYAQRWIPDRRPRVARGGGNPPPSE